MSLFNKKCIWKPQKLPVHTGQDDYLSRKQKEINVGRDVERSGHFTLLGAM